MIQRLASQGIRVFYPFFAAVSHAAFLPHDRMIQSSGYIGARLNLMKRLSYHSVNLPLTLPMLVIPPVSLVVVFFALEYPHLQMPSSQGGESMSGGSMSFAGTMRDLSSLAARWAVLNRENKSHINPNPRRRIPRVTFPETG